MSWKAREFHFFGDLLGKRGEVECSSADEAARACERMARESGKDVELVKPNGDVNEWCTPDGTWRDHSGGDRLSEGPK